MPSSIINFINSFIIKSFMESNEIHQKIIKVLNEKGPSLPINIAKSIGMSSLFVSAFLSEMADEKKIQISHLKVGGSPLYFLDGQEERLEGFSTYLHPRENEAFMLLRDKKVLKDDEMEPAIRVALRSIRDFAVGFKKDEEIYWRYVLIGEEGVRDILEPKKKVIEEEKREMVKEVREIRAEKSMKKIIKGDKESEFDNPLVIKGSEKKKKAKSDFVLSVIDFIEKKGLKIVEEKDYKAKEYNSVVRIRSELGPIRFLCQAKNKKKISEGDLKKLLSEAQKIPLPAFFIYNGEISKKGNEYIEKYGSVLKAERISK